MDGGVEDDKLKIPWVSNMNVAQLITKLQTMDQTLLVCVVDYQDGELVASQVEEGYIEDSNHISPGVKVVFIHGNAYPTKEELKR